MTTRNAVVGLSVIVFILGLLSEVYGYSRSEEFGTIFFEFEMFLIVLATPTCLFFFKISRNIVYWSINTALLILLMAIQVVWIDIIIFDHFGYISTEHYYELKPYIEVVVVPIFLLIGIVPAALLRVYHKYVEGRA